MQRGLHGRVARHDAVVTTFALAGGQACRIPDLEQEGPIRPNDRPTFARVDDVDAIAVGCRDRPNANGVAPVLGEFRATGDTVSTRLV